MRVHLPFQVLVSIDRSGAHDLCLDAFGSPRFGEMRKSLPSNALHYNEERVCIDMLAYVHAYIADIHAHTAYPTLTRIVVEFHELVVNRSASLCHTGGE